ncbi:MAG: SRPBCC family protein [Limisphaerales bacterium]
MATIKHNFMIAASVGKVYAAVTTLEGLNGWWTTGTTGNPDKGGKSRFEFNNGLYNIMQVSDLRRNKFVAWKCCESIFAPGKEWIGTRVTFRFSRDKDRNTVVKFEHGGWRKATDFYGLCNFHWARFMVSLKSLCETGRGEPYVL